LHWLGICSSNTYSSVFRRELRTKFTSHTVCHLGQWYANEAKAKFSHTTTYPLLDAPHKNIHDLVDRNISFISSEDHVLDNRDEIIRNFQEIETQSSKLYSLMEEMLNEAERLCVKEGDCR
jgi:hypothetical protein